VGEAKDVNLENENLFDYIQNLGWKMVKTCAVDGGVGLAAPQLGIKKKIFIIADFEKPDVWKLTGNFTLVMNPVIYPVKGSERFTFPEGCLSVPGKTLSIARPREVDVTYWYFDKKGNLKQNLKERLEGHPSRVFQHEFDHLLGRDIVELYERQNSKKKRGRRKKKNK
jgi:peptide deformylase